MSSNACAAGIEGVRNLRILARSDFSLINWEQVQNVMTFINLLRISYLYEKPKLDWSDPLWYSNCESEYRSRQISFGTSVDWGSQGGSMSKSVKRFVWTLKSEEAVITIQAGGSPYG